MQPRPADTAVLEYGRPGDPLLVPNRLVGLDARNVSAWFGSHKVLERVSLTMEPGAVTALIGPSGCGKSTFLRILNRMHEMVSIASLAGQVMLGDSDIYDPGTRASDVRRRIGMVFQKPNPFPAMSIYDNVASGLKLAGIKVGNKDAVVEASLRRAGLWNEVHRRLKAPGGGLSGGQQQRLCIARALAVKPDVLLMDEPCSALDPTSTRRIEETIAELENQVTIVIVTHNMQQAQRVSRNCAFFLAAEDTPGAHRRGRAHGATVRQPLRPEDRRLRPRPLRLRGQVTRAKGSGAAPLPGPRLGIRRNRGLRRRRIHDRNHRHGRRGHLHR